MKVEFSLLHDHNNRGDLSAGLHQALDRWSFLIRLHCIQVTPQLHSCRNREESGQIDGDKWEREAISGFNPRKVDAGSQRVRSENDPCQERSTSLPFSSFIVCSERQTETDRQKPLETRSKIQLSTEIRKSRKVQLPALMEQSYWWFRQNPISPTPLSDWFSPLEDERPMRSRRHCRLSWGELHLTPNSKHSTKSASKLKSLDSRRWH